MTLPRAPHLGETPSGGRQDALRPPDGHCPQVGPRERPLFKGHRPAYHQDSLTVARPRKSTVLSLLYSFEN